VTELVLTAKAFADSTRVRILALIRSGELCVCELSDALQLTQSTLSTHLQVIREAALVETRKEGRWIYYSIHPAKQKLVDSFFGFFTEAVKKDPTTRRDSRNLKARLKERKDGACCVGFCQPKPRSHQ
jgi:ArsR family transcriptional regulator